MRSNKMTNNLLDEIETIAGQLTGAVTRLLELSSDRDAEIRMRAIEAMEHLDAAQVASRINAALVDPDELVRVAALEVVAGWKRESWLAPVVAALSDDSELVRSAAASALGEMGDDHAMSMLELKLARAQDEEKISILHALIKRGKQDYLPAFLDSLSHSFYRVRCATANLSYSIANDANRAAITRALEAALARETTRAARSSIEHALAELGASGSRPADSAP